MLNIKYELTTEKKPKPDESNLGFGIHPLSSWLKQF